MKIPIFSISLVKDGSLEVDKNKVICSEVAAKIAMNYIGAGADREYFIVMMLSSQNKINAINTVGMGSLNAAIAEPREVFKPAILHNSAAIVMAHNHPSGNVEPSKDDIELTRKIKEAGKILHIPLLDHVIVAPDGQYTSFADKGLI